MISFDDKCGAWKTLNLQSCTLHFIGAENFAREAIKIEAEQKHFDQYLKTLKDYTSAIIETPHHIIAWVDHIRSWPVFYSQSGKTLNLSNNARNLLNEGSILDPDAPLEFITSGYIAGENTFYKNIKCLQPGEFLIWDKQKSELVLTRYHQYTPDLNGPDKNWKENEIKMGRILDNITKKIIARADNRPIWIPLSGGFDSRIILCKFHEHGYKNIRTFSYGPKFNFEAKIAKKVAAKLGVPWMFISLSKREIREYFQSQTRWEFWQKADGLKSFPTMQDFTIFQHLKSKKLITDDAIIINGQSGDYITGNHISQKWLQDKKFDNSDLFQNIINKHYALWPELLTSKNLEYIYGYITRILSQFSKPEEKNQWAALEEMWEYDARQICYVVNGQRVYDYFGFDWELPLWEKDLVDFCEHLPLSQKQGQTLYKQYLRSYNYQNLFPETEPYIWRWPIHMLWVVPIAQILHVIKGRKSKDNFYALMRYFGHYSNQFAAFPWDIHKRTHRLTRNAVSLYVREWAKDNPGIIPKNLTAAMKLESETE